MLIRYKVILITILNLQILVKRETVLKISLPLSHSKSSILERLGKETNQNYASKSPEKPLLEHDSKALMKRFKDPIGFHQILNDMDVQISSFPKFYIPPPLLSPCPFHFS